MKNNVDFGNSNIVSMQVDDQSNFVKFSAYQDPYPKSNIEKAEELIQNLDREICQITKGLQERVVCKIYWPALLILNINLLYIIESDNYM